MPKPTYLTAYLFQGVPPTKSSAALARELGQWMDGSTRFTAFVETYRDKIRKKIRVAGSAEGVLDMRAELEVAYCLLLDRRFAVTYEPYASAKRRGPDFSVTYRANLLFNIEVARIRAEEGEIDLPQKKERIVRILLDKLGQMQPGMRNLLLINAQEKAARAVDLNRLMQEVKLRVEGRDPVFYAASRYPSPAAFYKDFLHLSGILFWAHGVEPWINRQAKPGLDEKVLRLVASAAPARLDGEEEG